MDVEVYRDFSDDELKHFAEFLRRMEVPAGTTVRSISSIGEQRTITIREVGTEQPS